MYARKVDHPKREAWSRQVRVSLAVAMTTQKNHLSSATLLRSRALVEVTISQVNYCPRCDRRMDTLGSLLGKVKEGASEHLRHPWAPSYDQPAGSVLNVSMIQAMVYPIGRP
jgi:hypothetical protein